MQALLLSLIVLPQTHLSAKPVSTQIRGNTLVLWAPPKWDGRPGSLSRCSRDALLAFSLFATLCTLRKAVPFPALVTFSQWRNEICGRHKRLATYETMAQGCPFLHPTHVHKGTERGCSHHNHAKSSLASFPSFTLASLKPLFIIIDN